MTGEGAKIGEVPSDKTDAYRIVYDDLIQCGAFRGIYDAKNGNEHFMYGVSCVMEVIASRVSDEVYDAFNDEFMNNMIESEEKANDAVESNKTV